MPQELHVLRCVDCGTFQVHIVKKVPKWSCKICQKKQSVLQVFARGSGKDCRLHVQRLNDRRLQEVTLPTAAIANEDDLVTDDDHESRSESEGDAFHIEHVGSKWDKYMDEKEESAEEEQDADIGFKDVGLARKRKCGHRTGISVPAKKPARFRAEAEDEYRPQAEDDHAECPPDVERPKNNLAEEQRPKQTQGRKGAEVTSKWAKYVDPAEEDDSGTEETFKAESEDVGEHEEDLDELLKF